MRLAALPFLLFPFVIGAIIDCGPITDWLNGLNIPYPANIVRDYLVDAIQWICSHINDGVGAIERFVAWGQGLLNTFYYYEGQFLNLVGSWFGWIHDVCINLYYQIRDVAYNWYNQVHDIIVNLYWQVRDVAYNWYSIIHDFCVNLYNSIRTVAYSWFGILHDFCVNLYNNIRTVCYSWFGILTNFVNTLYNGLVWLVQTAWNGLHWLLESAWNGLVWFINTGWHFLVGLINDPVGALRSTVFKILETFYMDLATLLGWLIKVLMSIDISKIMEA